MIGDSEAMSSKSSPNESLDALIDLVGSDDIMGDPRFCKQSSNDGLRDTDGKLHLGKIHSFFSAGQAPVLSAYSATARQYASDSSNDRVGQDMHGVEDSPLVGSVVPFNSGTNIIGVSPGTSYISRSIPDDEFPDSSHHELASFREPLSPRNVPADTYQGLFSPLDAQNQNSRGSIDGSSQFPPDSRASSMEPLEAEALNRALTAANKEVVELRRQCDHLRSLASVQAGTGDRALESPVLRPIYNNPDPDQTTDASTRSRLLATSAAVTNCKLSSDIEELTEQRAKEALASLLQFLSLPSSCLFDDAITSEIGLYRPHPNSIAGVQRALDFVIKTDELIWRRSVHSSVAGGATAAVFDDENLMAVFERLTLWERVMRGSR